MVQHTLHKIVINYVLEFEGKVAYIFERSVELESNGI